MLQLFAKILHNGSEVVKREIILKDVNGELFKPKYFRGYHPIASSTGIIRVSSLKELFPQYDLDMLVKLMVRLEFCHPVNISGFKTNLQPISTSASSTEVLLFFPSLLKAEQPQALTSCEHTLSRQVRFGWCLGCKDYEYQFLTSRFLHVLLQSLLLEERIPEQRCPALPRPSLDQWGTGGWCRQDVKGLVVH